MSTSVWKYDSRQVAQRDSGVFIQKPDSHPPWSLDGKVMINFSSPNPASSPHFQLAQTGKVTPGDPCPENSTHTRRNQAVHSFLHLTLSKTLSWQEAVPKRHIGLWKANGSNCNFKPFIAFGEKKKEFRRLFPGKFLN